VQGVAAMEPPASVPLWVIYAVLRVLGAGETQRRTLVDAVLQDFERLGREASDGPPQGGDTRKSPATRTSSA
jgi:hypothetical protein